MRRGAFKARRPLVGQVCPTCGRLMPSKDGRPFSHHVREYVEKHPGVTAREVREALEASSLRTRAALYQLTRAGSLRSVPGVRSTRFYPPRRPT